ncbi:hypothetical protein OOZ63_24855 [Paucibacter sp. PLA-PC-4]|uniref:hypothetical protein n=1 Tax=Paucibacter sp. PLA-PC-4 TaxID=2993655 RepID=UPI00224A7557|nr:hypothetical protein [Paucibacter sp. PLA-PC-4]MCX2865062.1 hypothetical protein [Paucibacter sp. PLA-PC-4]
MTNKELARGSFLSLDSVYAVPSRCKSLGRKNQIADHFDSEKTLKTQQKQSFTSENAVQKQALDEAARQVFKAKRKLMRDAYIDIPASRSRVPAYIDQRPVVASF